MKAHRHQENVDNDLEVFEEERQTLLPYRGQFDGFHEAHASVSKTCLGALRQQRYSSQRQRHRPSREVHAYAGRIVIARMDALSPNILRPSTRRVDLDPWHYVPVLARKPGALRNGAPFKDSVLLRIWIA